MLSKFPWVLYQLVSFFSHMKDPPCLRLTVVHLGFSICFPDIILHIFPLNYGSAGTGNGMAKSLLHSVNETCNVENATFAIIQGHNADFC
jgi:hypothetical protein